MHLTQVPQYENCGLQIEYVFILQCPAFLKEMRADAVRERTQCVHARTIALDQWRELCC